MTRWLAAGLTVALVATMAMSVPAQREIAAERAVGACGATVTVALATTQAWGVQHMVNAYSCRAELATMVARGTAGMWVRVYVPVTVNGF